MVKYKISRQVGEDIFNNPQNLKYYKQYGFQKLKKTKLYAKLARQRKILKAFYNLNHRQYSNLFKLTFKNAWDRQNPLLLLETRLDVFIMRACWVKTMVEAKQFILHGNILVNGCVVKHANYILTPGDLVQVIQEKSRPILEKLKGPFEDSETLRDSSENKRLLPIVEAPSYIHVNYNIMSAVLLRVPTITKIPYLVKLDAFKIKKFYQL